jgi:hypothetical protein
MKNINDIYKAMLDGKTVINDKGEEVLLKDKFLKLKVLGIDTFIYTTMVPYGSNGKYEWIEKDAKGIVLYGKNKKQLYKIYIKEEAGLDPKKKNKAVRGIFEIEKIEDSMPNKKDLWLKPKKGKKTIILPLDKIDYFSDDVYKNINNDLFYITYDGGNKSTPAGFYKFHYTNFKE